MGWEEDLFALFDDLEQQADALWDAERGWEVADRARAEYHAVTLASRLMATVGSPVGLAVRGVGHVDGVLERVARDWVLVRGSGQDWVVSLPAVVAVSAAAERSVPEVAWSPVTRLGLGSALRGLAEAGERCVLHAVDGTRHEGVPARVGADFVEVRVGGEDGAGGRPVLVALANLAAVQSR